MSSPDYTAAQHKAKQRFWRRVRAEGFLTTPDKLTLAQIARLAGDQKLAILLEDPAFHDWFMNDHAEMDLIKAGAESAIRALLDIVTGVEEAKNPAVKVSAAKILLDMAGFGAKNVKEPAVSDEQLSKMTEQELKTLIAKNIPAEN